MSALTSPPSPPSSRETLEDNPDYIPPSSSPTSPLLLHANFLSHLNGSDIDSISLMLASDNIRLQGERGSSPSIPGFQTKAKVLAKISEISKKITNSITNLSKPEINQMRSQNETRSIVAVKKGFVSVSFGVLIRWNSNNLANFLVFQKSPPPDFTLDDTTTDTDTPPTTDPESSTELLPPYLVTKPPFFPPPTLAITVVSASNLLNGSVMKARPVNAYVKFNLGSQKFKTDVVKMSSNPTFRADSSSKARLTLNDNNFDTLIVQVCDWKPLKHRLLAQVELPLSMFVVCNNGEAREVVVPLNMRWKKNGVGSLSLKVGYENLMLWWINAENEKRDEIAATEKKAEGGGGEGEGEGEKTSWFKFW